MSACCWCWVERLKAGNTRFINQLASAPLAVLPMPSREPELPETEDRRCPYCRYQRLAQEGPVTIAQGMIKETLRCQVCGVRFVFVRKMTG